jgi:hypothetical protein
MTDPEVVKLLRWLADEIDNGRAQPKMVEVNFDDDVEVEPRSWRDSPAEPPPRRRLVSNGVSYEIRIAALRRMS